MQEYLQRQRCYDLLPVSYKSIVLDSRLVVGKALMALLQNGLHSAPVWCASQQRIGDGWTLLPNDFIQLIVNAAANVNHAADCSQSVLMDQLHVCDLFNKHDDQRWSRRRHVGVDAMTNLLEASRLLTQDRRLHNLVLFDGTSATGALVGQMDRQRILKFIAVNYNNLSEFSVPIAETAMGTWINDDDSKQQLITIRPETPLFEVLRMFARHRVESLPVIDEDGGCLIDVCDQYELVSRIPTGLLDVLNDPIGQLINQWRHSGSSRNTQWHTCTRQSTVQSLLETIRQSSTPVSRFIVLDDDSTVNVNGKQRLGGVISVHDILSYLCL